MHWIVVTSQKEARVFTTSDRRRRLKLLKTFKNPLAGEKRRDLIRKEAGRGVKSFGRVGAVSYSQTKRRDPVDEAARQFARELSRFLDADRLKGNFESLTVVAEARLLGKIRSEMSRDLAHSVQRWLRKDLQKTPQRQLGEMLLDPKSPASVNRRRAKRAAASPAGVTASM